MADHRSHKRSRQKIHLRKVSPTVTNLQTHIFLVIKFLSHTRTHSYPNPPHSYTHRNTMQTNKLTLSQTHTHTHTLYQTYSTICAHASSHKHLHTPILTRTKISPRARTHFCTHTRLNTNFTNTLFSSWPFLFFSFLPCLKFHLSGIPFLHIWSIKLHLHFMQRLHFYFKKENKEIEFML